MGSDFIVHLPKTYYLDGERECALIETRFVPEFEEHTDQILICSDLIGQSYIKDTSRPVLRRIEILQEDKTDLTFNQRFYFDVNRTEMSRLHICILDDRLKQVHFKVDI